MQFANKRPEKSFIIFPIFKNPFRIHHLVILLKDGINTIALESIKQIFKRNTPIVSVYTHIADFGIAIMIIFISNGHEGNLWIT